MDTNLYTLTRIFRHFICIYTLSIKWEFMCVDLFVERIQVKVTLDLLNAIAMKWPIYVYVCMLMCTKMGEREKES